MKPVKAWHFMADRDGEPVLRNGEHCPAIGEMLTVGPPLEMCRRGLHASVRAWDALKYSPGWWVARVALGGEIKAQDDKLCATERTVVAGPVNAKCELLWFAASCAYRALERYGGRLTEEQMLACVYAADLVAALSTGAEIAEEDIIEARKAAADVAAEAASEAAFGAAYSAMSAAAGYATYSSAAAAHAADAAHYATAAASADAEIDAQNKLLEDLLNKALEEG